MKASVYTSLFNYSPDKFDLLGAFKNWSKYADEIVIATFEDQKDIVEFECDLTRFDLSRLGLNTINIKVVSCPETSLGDPLFDGKLKNAALQACSNELVIQQDMDERIGGDPEQWEYLAKSFDDFNYPITCAVPVIDLYKDYSHYKNIGFKFYFHKKTGIRRGVVNYAKKGDYINVNLSDTCEPLIEGDYLAPYFADDRFRQKFNINVPHIIHEGYLDLEKRIENNKFWSRVWSERAGEEIKVATTLEKLEEENEAKPHGLPVKWWE